MRPALQILHPACQLRFKATTTVGSLLKDRTGAEINHVLANGLDNMCSYQLNIQIAFYSTIEFAMNLIV